MTLSPALRQIMLVLMGLYVVALNTSLSAMEILNFIFFVVWLGALLWAGARGEWSWRKLDLFHWVAIAFLISVFISAYLSPYLTNYLRVVQLMRWWVYLFAVAFILRELRDKHELLLKILFVTAGLVAAYSIFTFFTGIEFTRPERAFDTYRAGGAEFLRVRGMFSHVMSYSYSLGIVLVCFFAAFFTNAFSQRFRRILSVALVLVFGAFILTFSRGAWIGALVALVLVAIVHSARTCIRVLAGLVIVLVTLSVLNTPVSSRLFSIANSLESRSVSQRINLWKSNIAMFQDRPLFGVGWQANRKLTRE